MNTNERPITYHCTVIEETIAAHSVKELTDKLAELGIDDKAVVNIAASVRGIKKEKAAESEA